MHFHSNYNYVSIHKNQKRKRIIYSITYAHQKQTNRHHICHWLIFLHSFSSLFYLLSLCSLYVVRLAKCHCIHTQDDDYYHAAGSVQKNKQTNTKCWIGEKQTQKDIKENKPKNDTLSTLTFGASIMKGNIPRGGKRHC